MRYNWDSPRHNWTLIEVIPAGAATTVQIWAGLSADSHSQKYELATTDETLAGLSAAEIEETALRLAMGHFRGVEEVTTDVIVMPGDGSIPRWTGALPMPLA